MTESDFNRLAAEGYNRIPVTLETFAKANIGALEGLLKRTHDDR